MNKVLLTAIFSLFFAASGIAQNLEDDFEFKYITAKYLLDKEKYEDAIKAFSEVVKEQEGYLDAMVLRAEAKYAMAAFKGVKKDVLRYTELKGMTPMSALLLGKADYKMGNTEAAMNSLELASMTNIADAQVFEFLGNLYKEDGKLMKACTMWKKGAALGSSKAAKSARKSCGAVEEDEVISSGPRKNAPGTGKLDPSTLPSKAEQGGKIDKPSPKPDVEMKDNRTPEQKRRDEDDSLNSPRKDQIPADDKNDPIVEKASEDEDVDPNDDGYGDLPPDDNTPNTIVIDEDLTLIIRGEGLGKRKVLDQPNILILSDEDGTVAIDICVNKRGKVESAEFNTKLSTIAKKSLVSLSIRKAKDFWFEKNDYKEQCGVIMFKIKGS